jgi:co-chaperonin GroES (HSP10)
LGRIDIDERCAITHAETTCALDGPRAIVAEVASCRAMVIVALDNEQYLIIEESEVLTIVSE